PRCHGAPSRAGRGRSRLIPHAALSARGIPLTAARRHRGAGRRRPALLSRRGDPRREDRIARVGGGCELDLLLLSHGVRRPGPPLLAAGGIPRREGGCHRQELREGVVEGEITWRRLSAGPSLLRARAPPSPACASSTSRGSWPARSAPCSSATWG